MTILLSGCVMRTILPTGATHQVYGTDNLIVLVSPDSPLLSALTTWCQAYLYAAGERDLGESKLPLHRKRQPSLL